MKFTIGTAEFKAALAKVKGALGTGANGENTKGITIQGSDNAITLTASNGLATVRTTAVATTDGGTFTADGKNLIAFVGKLPDGVVSFESDEKSLKVKAKGIRLKLPITADLPATVKNANINAECFAVPSLDFLEAMAAVLPCAAKGSSRAVLNGVAIRKNKNEGALAVACDSFKLAKHPLNIKADNSSDFAVIIPTEAVNTIISAITAEKTAEAIRLSQTGIKEMQMAVGDTTVFTSLIHGDYIDYNRIIPKNTKLIDLDTAEITAAMETAMIAVANSKESLPVKLVVENGVVSITAVSASADCTVELDSAMTEGFPDEFAIGFNPAYLMSLLKTFSDERLRLALNTNLTAMTISGGEQTAMILPVRLKD